MRATILPMAIILNKAHRAAFSMMAEGMKYISSVFLLLLCYNV